MGLSAPDASASAAGPGPASAIDEALAGFAAEIAPSGPVCVRGGGTRWGLGGDADPAARVVAAPAGVIDFEPAEMTVRVRAGTAVADLHEELAAAGQRTALPVRPSGTVGGALAAGESSPARLGLGAVRDALLQARYVDAEGRVVTAGAPTVKNVSGFDLCKLLVGSLGTIGLIGEALLRTRPVPEAERWVRAAGADPRAVLEQSRTAASILWDGAAVWVLASGYGVDVEADLAALSELGDFEPAESPDLPPHRWSCSPAEAAAFGPERLGGAGRFVAEIGVGVVHADAPQPSRPPSPGAARLNGRIKALFDPTGRLNPGRKP